jgi:hypothetical protein
MSVSERNSEIYEQEDYAENSMEKLMDKCHQNSKNIPVKTNLNKLNTFLSDLRRDLGDNNKAGQFLCSEIMTLAEKNKKQCNSITKMLMDDLINFQKEFKKTIQNDKSETDFFKQQVNVLNMEKTIIDQRRISLDTRLKQCEGHVGVDVNN